VVRGPDILWGGDIREFHPPANVFTGVIGGPPCQDFSGLRRAAPTGYGRLMLSEFERVVTEAQPEWWLAENVARVPDLIIAGWSHQRLDINQAWYGISRRLRHVQFGSRSGRLLHVTRHPVTGPHEGAALASDNRDFRTLCRLQGLPETFDLPPFRVEDKKKAVGNGVPLEMGLALAGAIIEAYQKPVVLQQTLEGQLVRSDVCACGCGRQVTGSQEYYDYSCRKRAQRGRERNRDSTTPPKSETGIILPISQENGPTGLIQGGFYE
jgi:DNA (cytosine-5)-methyltransferase 1